MTNKTRQEWIDYFKVIPADERMTAAINVCLDLQKQTQYITPTMSPKLPAVLQQNNGNSISIERALKNILAFVQDPIENQDSYMAVCDDLELMLSSINRG